MPKKLNIENLVPTDLEAPLGAHPWGDLIYDEGFAASSYAAQAALLSLADGWNDDAGRDRQYILSALDTTIQTLSAWREAFRNVVLTEDLIDGATERLAAIMAERRVTPAELTSISNTLDAANRARARAGFDEVALNGLVTAAFASKETT